jgi:hypothetical protein
MKTSILLFALLLPFKNLTAQSKRIEIELKPILEYNGKYYYDSKRVSFDGLTFPMLLLNDSSINRQIRNIQPVRTVASVVRLTTILYVLLVLPERTSSRQFKTSRSIILSMIAFGGGLIITEKIMREKIVTRYNSLVLAPIAIVVPGEMVGLGVRVRF